MESTVTAERHYCTLFDSSYVGRGIAMIQSLRNHSGKKIKIYVLAMDDQCEAILRKLNYPEIHVISLQNDFMTPKISKARNNRSWAEFCWTCAPLILKHCIDLFDLEECTYLDSDIFFFADPEELHRVTAANTAVLITPHNYAAEYDQSKTSGVYCVQFLPFRNNFEGIQILSQWTEDCLASCVLDPKNGKCGDQTYLNEWENRYKNVEVCKHKGVGVAPWNAIKFRYHTSQKKIFLRDTGDQTFRLIFYHFHALRFFRNHKYLLAGGDYKIPCFVFYHIYRPYLKILRSIHNSMPGISGEIIYGYNRNGELPLPKKVFGKIKYELKHVREAFRGNWNFSRSW